MLTAYKPHSHPSKVLLTIGLDRIICWINPFHRLTRIPKHKGSQIGAPELGDSTRVSLGSNSCVPSPQVCASPIMGGMISSYSSRKLGFSQVHQQYTGPIQRKLRYRDLRACSRVLDAMDDQLRSKWCCATPKIAVPREKRVSDDGLYRTQ